MSSTATPGPNRVVIGMDPHKRSATIEVMAPDEGIEGGGRFGTDGLLILDDTGFPKQGEHSVGVARRYTGTLGKVASCQVAVTLQFATAAHVVALDVVAQAVELGALPAGPQRRSTVELAQHGEPARQVLARRERVQGAQLARHLEGALPGGQPERAATAPALDPTKPWTVSDAAISAGSRVYVELQVLDASGATVDSLGGYIMTGK